jgi:hypothetical protein
MFYTGERQGDCDIIAAMQSSINWPRAFRLMALGAIGFWLPDTLLHAWRRYNFTGHDVWAVSVVCPLTFLATFFFCRSLDKNTLTKRIGPSLITGVWIFGGLFMMTGASFSSGGFASPNGIKWAVMSTLLSVVPIYTFILATYDGSLFALLLVTSVAAVSWAVRTKR